MNIKIDKIKEFSFNKLKSDHTGHGVDHLVRVADTAAKLARIYSADMFIVLAASYLHDTIDDKLVENSNSAIDEVKSFLSSLNISQQQINDIIYIITHMSYSYSLEHEVKLSLEGKIVQDADWLDAIGAIGVARALYYGGAHQTKIYDPQITPRYSMTKKEYRNLDNETVINHFYEKLLNIKDKLNTNEAREIAEKRQNFMLGFLQEFKAEWSNIK